MVRSRGRTLRDGIRPSPASVQFPGAVELGQTIRGRANHQVDSQCWGAMCSFLVPDAHVNYREDEADPYARAAYGANYDCLVALKDKYDPNKLFRINHNIRPTVPA
jgi:Berberine and berberine like